VRTAVILFLFFLATAATAQIRTVRAGDYEAATLSLPGFLVQSAAVTGPGGRPGVALLISGQKDRKGPKSLYFYDPASKAFTRLAAGLHEEVNAVTGFNLGGDGARIPVAGMPGILFTPSGGRPKQVLESTAIDLRSVTGSVEGRPWIPVARTGLLELLGPSGNGLARQGSFPLPVRAERQKWGLRLSSPPVTLLPGDPPLFAAGPREEGRRRVQTVLVPADGSGSYESWALLPGDERLLRDSHYLRVDGAPFLAVTTLEKIGVFAKKRFRLFALNRDRSRKGAGPVLAVETDCPLWFPLDATALDADGDGRQDLVLAHPGGLRGRELIVTAYRGLGGGKLDPEPRRWKLNDEATDWLYGLSLAGDGAPALLVYAGDHLLFYPGDPKGSRPLAGRPLWSFPIPGSPKKEKKGGDDELEGQESPGPERERFLEVLDLPGGGRIALARGAQGDGRTVITFVAKR
jgi:hypothetical protein